MYWNSEKLFDKLSAYLSTHTMCRGFTLTLRWIFESESHWDSEVLVGESREA